MTPIPYIPSETLATLDPVRDAFVLIPFIAAVAFCMRILVPRLLPRDTAPLVYRIIWVAFAMRVVFCILLHYTNYSWFLAPDENTYAINGARLARYWQGVEQYPVRIEFSSEKLYFYFNAALFWVFGYVKSLPKIINCGAGAISALYAYKIARGLFGRASGQISCALVAFFPSLILWSVVNIRDGWCVLAVLVIAWSLMCLRIEPRLGQIVGILIWLAILGSIRESTFAIVTMSSAASFLLLKGRDFARNVFVASLVLVGMVASGTMGVISTRHFSGSVGESLGSMQVIHQGLSTGSGVYGDIGEDIATPIGALKWLPRGLVYFVFGPFPWDARGALQIISLPEVFAWYLCIYYAFVGALFSLKHGRLETWVLFILLVNLTVVFALVEGNVGTAYRHRAQVLPMYLIFASLGIFLRHMSSRLPPSARSRPPRTLQ